MEKELIINSTQKEVQLALVENRKLVELHNQPLKNNLIVGDIYLFTPPPVKLLLLENLFLTLF